MVTISMPREGIMGMMALRIWWLQTIREEERPLAFAVLT